MGAKQSSLHFGVLGTASCHATVHPWTPSCARFYLEALRRMLLGTASVFAPLYCIPVAIRTFKDGVNINDIEGALLSSLRTTMYVSTHASLSLGLACAFRAGLGSFQQYSSAFIPTVVAGLGVLFEDQAKWNPVMVMLGNTLLERLLLLGEREAGLRLSPALLTALFMASSGPLLYLLRRRDFRCLLSAIDSPWFFYPPSVKDEKLSREGDASHNLRQQLLVALRLAGAGVALEAARAVVKNVRRPAALARRLISADTYRLGLFLGAYALLYQVGSWAVRARRGGRDETWHALAAGALAGAALRLYPRRLLALMPCTTVLQLLIKWICKKKKLKYVPLWKFIFIALSTAYMVHSYFIDPDYIPIWFDAILGSVTGGITVDLRKRLLSIWHHSRFPVVVGGL